MPKSITIKDFKGVNLKEGLWDQGFSGYACGVDIYGLGDDYTKISIEGVAQAALQLSSMPVDSNYGQLFGDMAWFNSTSRVYAVDTSATGQLFKWVPATPQWTLSATAASTYRIRNIAQYNNLLYLTSATGSAGTANGAIYSYADNSGGFVSLATGLNTADPMPMKVFSGFLFVANGRYVDRYDGTNYQAQKLILPVEFTVRSMEVFRDGLYISADNGQYSRIFIWDGSSPTYTDSLPLYQEAFAPSLQTAQNFLWVIGNRGIKKDGTQTTALTPIYIITPGSQPDLLFELPIYRSRSPGANQPMAGTGSYQNGILIASSGDLKNVDDDYPGGVWYIGKDLATGLFHACLMFPTGYKSSLGAVFSSGTTQDSRVANTPAMYVSFNDYLNNNFQVGQAASMSVLSNASLQSSIWQTLPIDAASTKRKSWVAVKIGMDALGSNQTVQVSYRLEDDSNFTVLKTFTNEGSATKPFQQRMMQIPIGRTSRTITIRVQISGTVPVATPRFHSITLFYEPTGEL